MSKFKVGDKVVRVSRTNGKAIKGGVYEVSEVSEKNKNDEWAGSFKINLKGHEVVSGEFKYESSCFELYDDDVLSPLEAAEALLNKDSLQIYDINDNKWYGFHSELRKITLEDLKHIKLRYKPKMVVINGVEVPAPSETIERKFGYTPSLCHKQVHTVVAEKGRLLWATEEDAQKALDAMLLPFKDLNRGDK